MAHLQIKDVPDEVHTELRRRAAERGVSVRDYLLDLLRADQSKPSHEEWMARLAALPPLRGEHGGAELVAAARAEREATNPV